MHASSSHSTTPNEAKTRTLQYATVFPITAVVPAVDLAESDRFVADSPCDIIAANLSIDQIVSLYAELDKSLADDGHIVYSGIPADDKNRFLEFIGKMPYKLVDELSGSEWISYIGKKDSP